VNKSPLLRFQHFQRDAGLILSDHTTVSSGTSGKEPESVCFCAHFGTSMNPTLSELDVLEIAPYATQSVRVGDVIFFVPPGWNRPAVHRVVHLTSEGIRTRGDNNNRMDTWVLRPENVIGQVVRAARGKRRRPIYGGIAGRLWAFGVRVLKVLVKFPSLVYHFLARSELFRYLLPLHNRMRIITIKQPAGEELQLVLGCWLVGRRKPGMEQWWIRRPFRLFVDVDFLPQ
jgi:signal peptidase I